MSLLVLERIKLSQRNENVILKTVRNGNLMVYNVPHIVRVNNFAPNGGSENIPGDVMYNLAHIFRIMLDQNETEYDYTKFKKPSSLD